MCGIAGQVALNGAVSADAEQVTRMLTAMTHRGPDGQGLFVDARRWVALGSRRLAVSDLDSGDQPMFNEDRSIACVFNGEIYNFQTLRAELERRGHAFRSRSDTETIVHLYEEEGPTCVRRLRGMFAFAIWDGREDCLLLARDRVGEKPLYYAEAAERFSFASEIQALYDLPWLRKDVDPVALDLYLTHSCIPAPHAIFGAIRKLLPAHVLTVRNGRVESRQYWRLEAGETVDASREELVRAVREKVDESVQLRMVSDVPLGCFLSGGVDSSSVVALMSRASAKPVKTFSIGFSADRFNELEYARTVAGLYRTEHREYIVEPDALAVLPQIIRHFGEPFGDSSALPTWYVSKLARQHVTVALNGDGGDELFGGYPWYRTALTLSRVGRALPAWVPPGIAAGAPLVGERVARLGRRLGMSPGARFASLRQVLGPDEKRRLYSPSFLARAGGVADTYLSRRYEAACGDELARMQYTDTTTYLPDDLLVKVDRMTMAHSLEGRAPLLDHELMELCARIPSGLKIGQTGTKIIFRQAMEDLFPPKFLDRPKMGFSVPLAQWLRGGLREECLRTIGGDAFAEYGWFARRAVREMLAEHRAGRRDWSALIWNMLVLAEWAKVYLV